MKTTTSPSLIVDSVAPLRWSSATVAQLNMLPRANFVVTTGGYPGNWAGARGKKAGAHTLGVPVDISRFDADPNLSLPTPPVRLHPPELPVALVYEHQDAWAPAAGDTQAHRA